MIQFDLPQKKSSIIKVFGIGGGGGNAVNFMHSEGIEGVDFVLCNTDVKALNASNISNKIQLGPNLTEGLGAGADPEIGELATEESIAEITSILKDNTKMVFVTAGMGGGTGTGGAPIVAKVAKDLKILTVGIVTTPFSHEGKRRMRQAEEGISKMRESVDTILVISNDKLRHQYGNLGFREAFSKADDVLATATRCITDVINSSGHVVVDFADVCTVMRNGGVAILGSASASGENRAQEAVEAAISSPLLNDDDITGAKWVLINITSAEGSSEHTIDEMDLIQNYVQLKAGNGCDVILGTGYDNTLGDAIGVTIIATGFQYNNTDACFDTTVKVEKEVEVVHFLGQKPTESVTESVTVDNSPATNMPLAANLMPTVEVETPTNTSFYNPEPVAPVEPPIALDEPFVTHNLQMETSEMPTEFIPTLEDATQETPIDSITFQVSNTQELHTEVPDIPSEYVAPATPITWDIATEVNDAVQEPTATHLPESTIENKIENNIESIPHAIEIPQIAFQPNVVNNQEVTDDFITRNGITINRKQGSRYLSEDEIVEKINFELQKKAFEDRANSLRSNNFTQNPAASNQDLENIPAYLRAKPNFEEMNLNNNLSNYTVNNHEISSRNNFLDGERPD